ncbi:MAG: hypothetical protein ACFE8C_13405 [Promethearchaeota archaeon]
MNVPKCILIHTSFHRWNIDKFLAGLTPMESKNFEKDNPGLKFAYDGLRVEL